MIKEVAAKLIKHIPFANESSSNGLNSTAAGKLKNAAQSDKNSYFSMLESKETGLSMEAVHERQKAIGLNEIAHEKAPAWYVQFL